MNRGDKKDKSIKMEILKTTDFGPATLNYCYLSLFGQFLFIGVLTFFSFIQPIFIDHYHLLDSNELRIKNEKTCGNGWKRTLK